MVDIGAFEDQISGTAPGSQNATQGVSGSFTLGSFSDQATPATNWDVDVNWGDGSTDTTLSPTSQGSLGSAGHTYNTAGAKTVAVTVSDSYGDVGQYSFSVNVLALTSIAVTPANPSVAKGLTQQFTATGTYTDGSTADLTSQVTWASATPSVATINSSQGLAQRWPRARRTSPPPWAASPAQRHADGDRGGADVDRGGPGEPVGRQGPHRAVHRHRHLHRRLDRRSHRPGDLGVGDDLGRDDHAAAGLASDAGHRHDRITAALGSITSPSDTLTVTAAALTRSR